MMSKSKFIEDKEQLKKLVPVSNAPIKKQVFVCSGKPCLALGSAEVKFAFEEGLQKRNLRVGKAAKGRNPNGEIVLTDCSSVGLCAVGTAVLVYPDGVWYAQVRAEDVPEIVEEHLIKGNIVKRLTVIEKIPA